MVSARWVWRPTPFRSASPAVSRMISGVTEKGEQGASATWTKAPSPGSWKASIARLAVREDGVGVLDDGCGRQAPVLDREVHGAAGQGHPHAHVPRRRGLDVDRLLEPRRKHVVVVRRRRAAGEQQLGEGEPRRGVEMLRRQSRPHRVEGLQPVEELLAEGGTVGARQGLVEMMVGVDETR